MSPAVVQIVCADGVVIDATVFPAEKPVAVVVINCATSTSARYYRRYAEFLCENDITAITWDCRDIGESRRGSLRGSRTRWRTWGEVDFDAVLGWVRDRYPSLPIMVVGHSWGGFMVGFAPNSVAVTRILTVGAQHAYWPDYIRSRRVSMLIKWHLVMPAVTALVGYFPGKRLGWLEDTPARVVYGWAFSRSDFTAWFRDAADVRARFAAVAAPIRAYGTTDDEFGTPAAIVRGLAPYVGARRERIELVPSELGYESIGHFGLFHSRHRDDFWVQTLEWLTSGMPRRP
ncbi:alpha/beta hydrolase [Rhodococcoides trifolii]|uniref:Alpha/beta hydrolase n=1 Tax=Rhodococcoides trifolii TaxID=908250 RepID=A0A917LEF9_9NOCA|nr:alpha/beta fold hydrolase [Rhodococcus trifolii]GGG15396.1 alpha/beta hydrolase [Rhodococcus trifolii]